MRPVERKDTEEEEHVATTTTMTAKMADFETRGGKVTPKTGNYTLP